jgi:hypothetical protein
MLHCRHSQFIRVDYSKGGRGNDIGKFAQASGVSLRECRVQGIIYLGNMTHKAYFLVLPGVLQLLAPVKIMTP